MDKADDAGFVRVDLVLLIHDAVAERGEAAEAQTLLGVLAHPATDILGELAGIFLRHGLQDRLQQHALAAVADALGDGQNAHAICCPLTGVTTLAGVTRLVFRAPAGFSIGV